MMLPCLSHSGGILTQLSHSAQELYWHLQDPPELCCCYYKQTLPYHSGRYQESFLRHYEMKNSLLIVSESLLKSLGKPT